MELQNAERRQNDMRAVGHNRKGPTMSCTASHNRSDSFRYHHVKIRLAAFMQQKSCSSLRESGETRRQNQWFALAGGHDLRQK